MFIEYSCIEVVVAYKTNLKIVDSLFSLIIFSVSFLVNILNILPFNVISDNANYPKLPKVLEGLISCYVLFPSDS